MSNRSLIDECKVHFLEYRDLLMANDIEGVKAKLMSDADLDPNDYMRTVNLQQSALVMTWNNKLVEEEYNHLNKIQKEYIKNKALYQHG